MSTIASIESLLLARRVLAIPLLLGLLAGRLHAQANGTDYQLRLLAHTQQLATGHTTGLAGWVVLPDIANSRPVRALLLAGVVFKGTSRWLELMGGALVNTRTAASAEVDARYSDNSQRWLSFYLEGEYNFASRKLLLQPIATTPVRIGSIALKVGAESDLVLVDGKWSLVAGPRVVVPLRFCRAFAKECGVSLALRFGNGSRVIRQIVAFTF